MAERQEGELRGGGAWGCLAGVGARSELRFKVGAGEGYGRGEAGSRGRSHRESRQSEGRTEPSEHSCEGSGERGAAPEGGEGQQGLCQGPPGLS